MVPLQLATRVLGLKLEKIISITSVSGRFVAIKIREIDFPPKSRILPLRVESNAFLVVVMVRFEQTT